MLTVTLMLAAAGVVAVSFDADKEGLTCWGLALLTAKLIT